MTDKMDGSGRDGRNLGSRTVSPASPDIQVSRFDTLMRRLMGVKRGGLINRVDDKLSISIDPEDADAHPEYAYAAGTRLWSASANVAGVAATNGVVGIRNQPGSGVLVVVQRAELQTSVADASFAAWAPDQLTGTVDVSAFSRDTRYGKNPLAVGMSALLMTGNVAPVYLNSQFFWQKLAIGTGISQVGGLPLVLSPGSFLYLRSGALAVGMMANIWGYERTMEQSEK